MELPPWLDADFLATVLQGGEDDIPRVKVLKFSGRPAVAAGNNYMSNLYRVRVIYSVEGQEKELSDSFIIKAPISKGAMSDVKAMTEVFEVETRMYRDLLPKFLEKINMEFGPKQSDCPVKNVLVFNDLTEEGYITCDKFKQLDFHHCEYTLKTLAKFHATSVACHKEDPLLVEELGEERFYNPNEYFEQTEKVWIKKSLEIVAGVLNELGEEKASVQFLLSKVNTIADSLVLFCKPKEKGLNVLNHGDFWINNMMFKHNDSGEIDNMKFIDFQILRYITPACDLVYFLFSSANKDVRENRFQELLDVYLKTLNDTLEQLGLEERYSREELEEDLQNSVDMAVLTCCNMLPFMLSEPQDAINMEDVSYEDLKSDEIDDKYLKIYNGRKYKAVLPDLIRHLRSWTTTLEQRIK